MVPVAASTGSGVARQLVNATPTPDRRAHIGPAGRFAHLGYEAEIYAWILDRLRPRNP